MKHGQGRAMLAKSGCGARAGGEKFAEHLNRWWRWPGFYAAETGGPS